MKYLMCPKLFGVERRTMHCLDSAIVRIDTTIVHTVTTHNLYKKEDLVL